MLSAQVSVYPLRQERLAPAIDTVLDAFHREGLEAQVGVMSTLVTGETGPVFAALREGFERAAASGELVMVVALSNACPVGPADE